MAPPVKPKDKAKFAFVADTSILTEDEVAELELQAEKEVEDERRAAAKAQMLADLKSKKSRAAGLEEAYTDVYVDLAPYCDRILLDNRAFLQGQTYNVSVSQAATMREIMQRSWGHQSEIDGKSENWYRKQRGGRVVPTAGGGAAVVNTTSSLLRT